MTKWIACFEQMPESGATVLAFWMPDIGDPNPQNWGVATYECGRWFDPENDLIDYRNPSHWMALPKAPRRQS